MIWIFQQCDLWIQDLFDRAVPADWAAIETENGALLGPNIGISQEIFYTQMKVVIQE